MSYIAQRCRDCRKSIANIRKFNRSLRLVKAVAEDRPMKAIACDWNLSLKVLQWHWAHAKRALQFQTFVGATKVALRLNLITLTS